MKCSKCGTELIEGTKFCSECGEKVVTEHDENTLEMMKSIAQSQMKTKQEISTKPKIEQNRLVNKFPIISLIVLIAGIIIPWFVGMPFSGNIRTYAIVVFVLILMCEISALVLAIFGIIKSKNTLDKVTFSKVMAIISGVFIVINLILCVLVFSNMNGTKNQNTTTNSTSTETTTSSNQNKISESNSSASSNSSGTTVKQINLNDPITNGYFDFSLTSSEWLDEIYPPNKEGVGYYADKEGETYFVIHGNCKSNYSSSKSFINMMEEQLVFDGKYKYSGSASVISPDGKDMDSSIKPLQEGDFFIYFSVPDSVKSGTGTLTGNIAVGDGEHYINDDGSNAVGLYQINFAR